MNLANMWAMEPERLDPEDAARMSDLIGRVADQVVRRRLAPVALVVLETGRPLSFVGSQALVFLDPLVKLFLNVKDYDLFVKLLEDRDRVEQLIAAIEERT